MSYSDTFAIVGKFRQIRPHVTRPVISALVHLEILIASYHTKLIQPFPSALLEWLHHQRRQPQDKLRDKEK